MRKPLTLAFLAVLLITVSSKAQSLPQVVDFLNGTIGVALDSLENELKYENKRLTGNGYGIHELYAKHGIYTLETDINDEYITKAIFVPYNENWFDDQNWDNYEIEEQENEEYADHIFMYRNGNVYFYRIKTMEDEKQLAIWNSIEY